MSTDVSHDPRTGGTAPGPDHSAPAAIAAVTAAAAGAAGPLAAADPADRTRWLEAIADALDANAPELIDLADAETALGVERLTGELTRAAVNLRYYAAAGAAGGWLRARIQGVPGPPPLDLRRADLPIGPVAVFGASNFPFQFGVLGHDTGSALAAGCPVVAKAHPAHPRLSVRLADLAGAALRRAGAPDGTLSLVVGFQAGTALVDAEEIAAVAFTGSQPGGMALLERARNRPRPIPVYAEMGTVNPVLVTPAAAGLATGIAEQYVGSFTLGAGQFCTKPGLLLAPSGSPVADEIAGLAADVDGAHLLSAGIADAYRSGVDELIAAGAAVVAAGTEPRAGYAVRPTVLRVGTDDLQPGSRLLAECFGPVTLIADYTRLDTALAVLRRLQPSLAGSVYTGGPGDPDTAAAVSALARQVGRVIVDGPPTSVACVDAMHHGGPWPATSDPRSTSVGADALRRFTRPVSFQNVPDAALPPALQDGNPWRIERDQR